MRLPAHIREVFIVAAMALVPFSPVAASLVFAEYTPVYSDGNGCTNMDGQFVGSVTTDRDADGNYTVGRATITIPAGACPEIITFASYAHDGTLLPYENQRLYDSISAWYGPGTHQIGPLKIACNFQTDLYFGSVINQWPHEGAIVIPGPGVGGSIYIAANAVEHQNCTPKPPPPPPPTTKKPVCTITASPATIKYGGDTKLSWTSKDATSASINSLGTVALAGSQSLKNFISTKTYTMTVKGGGGTATCRTTVTVKPPRKPVCTLKVGGDPFLVWTTKYANSVTISPTIGKTWLNASAKIPYPHVDTLYTLTAKGPSGETTCKVNVKAGTK